MHGYGKLSHHFFQTLAPISACLMLMALLCGQALAVTTPANSIKRYMFSAPDQDRLQQQFIQRQIQLKSPQLLRNMPARLQTEGTGRSGLPSQFVIEQVGGEFHVYALRLRPQHPVSPLPYQTQEVVFDTADPAVSPVGTLSYPSGDGLFPALVLIAGSGPHDRDGNVSLHKTQAVLADQLTRQGFAVLRYDKRGIGLTGGSLHPGSTTDDYAADALAAVQFLQKQPNVDARRIGLIGHSEGGLIATMVAAKAPDSVQFIALLAAPGLNGVDSLSLQDATTRRAEAMQDALVRANQQQELQLFRIAAGELDHQAAQAAMAKATAALPQALRTQLEIPAEGIPPEALEPLLTPWLRRYLALDPAVYLRQLHCPVLVLHGDKDLQVPAATHVAAIKNALPANKHNQVVVLSGLNHLLQMAKTGHPTEYLLIEQTIAPEALTTLSGWLNQVAVKPASHLDQAR